MSHSRNQLSATEQPQPILNEQPAVWQVVIQDVNEWWSSTNAPEVSIRSALIQDMTDRDNFGREKYKVPLQPFNGRDALVDLYQEFLDATVYTRQLLLENPQTGPFPDLYTTLLRMLVTIRTELYLRDGK